MKKPPLIALTLLISLLSFSQSLKKQHKNSFEMVVDMPDETQGTDVIEKGQWQIETAYLKNVYENGPKSSVAQGLLRYGLSKRLELRLLVEAGTQLHKYIEETVQSTFPASVSVKFAFVKEHPVLPDITLVSYLHLPVIKSEGDDKLYWSPIFILAFKNELSKKLTLEYNCGIQQGAYDTEWSWVVNGALHYKIFDRLEIFGEYFSQYHALDSPQHNLGTGVAYQLNNNLELFAMTGSTLNYSESNHFVNGGVAIRIP